MIIITINKKSLELIDILWPVLITNTSCTSYALALLDLYLTNSNIEVIFMECTPHNHHKKLTSAVNNGEKYLVDFIRQPDGKSLGILE